MKILLTGASGYVGKRLLPVLVEFGFDVVCTVRDKRRFSLEDYQPESRKKITVVEVDLNELDSVDRIPQDIDAAFYLVHSMSSSAKNFGALEEQSAQNFVQRINSTQAQQIIYLGGISNDQDLSKHLTSRKNVEEVLKTSDKPVTILRAAIIIGSGSASFEIIRDLVEKLPVMIAPKWLSTRCQPIGIRNVIEYLKGVLFRKETYNQTFDVGGPDILSYNEMLMGYASVRGLKRLIIPVPVLSPKLSSLWLYFVTSTSYSLARTLVSSLKNEVICSDNRIQQIIPVTLLSYERTLAIALDRIQNKMVISSWKDTLSYSPWHKTLFDNVEVPDHGCFKDVRTVAFTRASNEIIENIWSIGGDRGWYFGNILWRIRGIADKAVGGVGLRRGRRSANELNAGDALDFWRVLLADKTNGRLLLFAEMKLPGEAWLEFRIKELNGKKELIQTATFRPLGVWGRIYWYSVLPFHGLIFPKMVRNIVKI